MSTPTSSETVTSNIPAWAKDYATQLLDLGKALALPKQKIDPATGKPMVDPSGRPMYDTGFTPYGGELVADFSDLQKQAMFGKQKLDAAGKPVLDASGKPVFEGGISNMTVAPQIGQATGLTGLAALQAQELSKYNPIEDKQYYQSAYDQQGGLDKYMSPYIQNVLEQQKREASRDYARQIPGMGAASARMGARGGSREALMRSEGQRNFQQQLQGIQATGMQNAFQNAQQQAAQDAQMRAQYGLAGSQLREQSRQFGAGLGLQGLEQQRLAAKQLADIGGQQFEQQRNIFGDQMKAGREQQNLTQNKLASNYQRFIDEQQYPYKQLEFFSNLLRGLPAGDTTRSLYTQGPNTAAQLLGPLAGG